MNVLTFILFLGWLVCGYFIVRFVLRTGGFTVVGRIAHWFGATFVMMVLGAGLAIVLAQMNRDFGARANVYLLTHQPRGEYSVPLLQQHTQNTFITIYRHGSINTGAQLIDGRLNINELQTIRTSWWWMLWDTKFTRTQL